MEVSRKELEYILDKFIKFCDLNSSVKLDNVLFNNVNDIINWFITQEYEAL
jgi:hypothetical protein